MQQQQVIGSLGRYKSPTSHHTAMIIQASYSINFGWMLLSNLNFELE